MKIKNNVCGVCGGDHRRICLKVKNVEICFDCLDFFVNLAKCDKKKLFDEIDYQIDYMLKNSIKAQ